MAEQALESFESQDKQRMIDNRIRQSVRQGMVGVLNVGFPEGKMIFYPTHQRKITMPEPGSTIEVPREVAEWLVRMFSQQLQYVQPGQMPANFTPPPGYKLVPVEPVVPALDEEDLLVEPEDKE